MPASLTLPPVVVDGLTVRELPMDEWARIAEAPGALHGVTLSPDLDVRILVAEDRGGIVAYWVVSRMVHLDPLWIAAPYRNRTHFQLTFIGALLEILAQEQVTHVFALIADGDQPANGALAEKLGLTRVPGALYAGAPIQPIEE